MNNIIIKKSIPQALRQQVWLNRIGEKFSGKCTTNWCKNTINVFNFECGHDKPQSKGGETVLKNLFPLCRQCNGSMGNKYSISEWQKFGLQSRRICSFSYFN
jgi:5-methylcytosine-specific restriction endonuclease McrA